MYFLHLLLLCRTIILSQICEHRSVVMVSMNGVCSRRLRFRRTACGVRLEIMKLVVWAATLETGTTPLLRVLLGL